MVKLHRLLITPNRIDFWNIRKTVLLNFNGSRGADLFWDGKTENQNRRHWKTKKILGKDLERGNNIRCRNDTVTLRVRPMVDCQTGAHNQSAAACAVFVHSSRQEVALRRRRLNLNVHRWSADVASLAMTPENPTTNWGLKFPSFVLPLIDETPNNRLSSLLSHQTLIIRCYKYSFRVL